MHIVPSEKRTCTDTKYRGSTQHRDVEINPTSVIAPILLVPERGCNLASTSECQTKLHAAQTKSQSQHNKVQQIDLVFGLLLLPIETSNSALCYQLLAILNYFFIIMSFVLEILIVILLILVVPLVNAIDFLLSCIDGLGVIRMLDIIQVRAVTNRAIGLRVVPVLPIREQSLLLRILTLLAPRRLISLFAVFSTIMTFILVFCHSF